MHSIQDNNLPCVIGRHNVARPTSLIAALEAARNEKAVDILFAGKLLQYWSDGTKKRLITFEHTNGSLPHHIPKGQTEDPSYAKERWNPFNGIAVVNPAIAAQLPTKSTYTENALLDFVQRKGYSTLIDPRFVAEEHLTINWHSLSFQELIKKHRRFRQVAVFFYALIQNLYHLITEGSRWRAYQKEIARVIDQKEIVLDLRYGGIGDCLCFSTLPKKLFETYGVAFYLTEQSREVVRSPDFLKLCFEMNPFFKGYKSGPAFNHQIFVRERSVKRMVVDRAGESAVESIEKQFKVPVSGVPEIFYAPTTIPDYKKVLLCDRNWFTGEKLGLFYDETLMQEEIDSWVKQGSEYTVEYVDTRKQTIFNYLDKIHSCGKFVCTFSGGNALAAALHKNNTVVPVPENLDGTALSNFLFTRAAITYKRRKSLAAYLSSVLHYHLDTEPSHTEQTHVYRGRP